MSKESLEQRKPVADLGILSKVVSGVLVIMVTQLLGAIWWAATITTSLSYVREEVVSLKLELKQNRYSSSDAIKDFENVNIRIRQNALEIEKLKELFNRYVIRGHRNNNE